MNLAQVKKRKQRIVKRFRGNGEQSIAATEGLDLIRGKAGFIDAHTVNVERAGSEALHLVSKKVFINTTASPVIPPIDGLDEARFLDATSIMELDMLPKHFVIISGGYVAVEFGQIFRRFGSRVTIIERGEQLLGREDRDVAEEVSKILRDDGIDVRFRAKASRVTKNKKEDIQLPLNGDDGEVTIKGSNLLVAAGRRPNTDRLNLSAAGRTPSSGSAGTETACRCIPLGIRENTA